MMKSMMVTNENHAHLKANDAKNYRKLSGKNDRARDLAILTPDQQQCKIYPDRRMINKYVFVLYTLVYILVMIQHMFQKWQITVFSQRIYFRSF